MLKWQRRNSGTIKKALAYRNRTADYDDDERRDHDHKSTKLENIRLLFFTGKQIHTIDIYYQYATYVYWKKLKK